MSEYTPTTEEIREYVEVGGEPKPWEPITDESEALEAKRAAAFDRWLAAHDQDVARKAIRHHLHNLGLDGGLRAHDAEVATAERERAAAIAESLDDVSISGAVIASEIRRWTSSPHTYGDSFTGMLCGAMVELADGSGDECGLPASHPVHKSKASEALHDSTDSERDN